MRRLEWTVIRRLDGLLQGDYRTLLRGTGLDLADLREYQHHDDVRHIDWNVTARLQIPHVRVFTEDREMAAWFLLDLSPSIDFGSGEQRKRDVSAEFVARAGAHADAPWQPRRRADVRLRRRHRDAGPRRAAARAATAARDADAARWSPNRAAPGCTSCCIRPWRTVRRRSTVFVVSDFISEPGWETPLGQLAQRHDVVAIRLLDPMELDLPDLGLVPIRDAETGEQLLVDTHDSGFRKRFARIAAQREADLRQALRAGRRRHAGTFDRRRPRTGSRCDFADLRKRRSRLSGVKAAATLTRAA